MFYSRVLLKDETEIKEYLQKNMYQKVSDFAFYDLVYINKNGNSITDDTLKIRVYQHNEWKNKSVLVILKRAIFTGNQKEDKVLVREEFDDLDSAMRFVQENCEDQYNFSFKLEKTGVQYQTETVTIWLENIVDLGISIEIGSQNPDAIHQVIQQLDIVEKLEVSVPEYMYQKIINKKK